MASEDVQVSAPAEAVTPVGVNHLVLNVHNMEESHAFWTGIMGFKQVGQLKPGTIPDVKLKMRFYSGETDGDVSHHDLALVEMPGLPERPANWDMFNNPQAINHVAITLPDRESWQKQVAFLRSKGIKFNMRINHGMTHSVYINDPNGYGIEVLYDLPRELWGQDIDAALNYAELLPTEGDEAMVDKTDNPVFSKA